MTEKEVIVKLNTLKSIKPDSNWLIRTKNMVLSEAGLESGEFSAETETEKELVFSKKPAFVFDFRALLGSHRKLAYAFVSCVFVLSLGAVTINASNSSIPGESLYSIKIAGENVVLAATPEEEKASVEIEYAGKRLEELAKISEKPSDVAQHQKVEQLISNYNEKVNSAKDRLAKINSSGDGKKAVSVAKVINTQSEKYADALAKTTDSLPADVKEKVSNKVAQAIDSTEKANTSSLLVLIEQKEAGNGDEISNEEIADKVNKKIDKIENSIKTTNNSDSTAIPSENTGVSGSANDNQSASPIGASATTTTATTTTSASPNPTDTNASPSATGNKNAGVSNEEKPQSADVSGENKPLSGDSSATAAKDTADIKKEMVGKARESVGNNQLLDAMKIVAEAENMREEEKNKQEIPFLPIFIDETNKNVTTEKPAENTETNDESQ